GVADAQPDTGVADRGVADTGMTRSEEQLRVGTETRESGTVRIHKYIVTETLTQTIPVRREEIRIEELPLESAGEVTAAGPGVERIGTPFEEGEYEIILYEERPIIELETVPVERITLTKETITEAETVSGEVRKEVIEATESR
ncbi:YsnF/AvaK domain-containing protein, partial [Arthrobacter sp. H41]|uniref:YsnF/AvaK domain-containing protein n=1 Tax=Arthrobacter sp. H41 TaxID=1312978 RepID=UPI00138AF115